MDFITQLIGTSASQVWVSLTHNWPFLLISVIIAVGMQFFLDPKKVSAILTRYQRGGVLGATLLAVGSPLCSCGTTAVVLGMMASFIPWAPIIAFMVSSPLTSPGELIYSAGLFGWPFALAFFISSILLGLLGGAAGWFFESRGWLKNQTRFSNQSKPAAADRPAVKLQPAVALAGAQSAACACSAAPLPVASAPASCGCGKPEVAPAQPAAASCGCGKPEAAPAQPAAASCGCSAEPVSEKPKTRVDWKAFGKECFATGKRLLLMFLGFAFIGYFLNGLIPSEWVAAVFGAGNVYSVPLAAILGLPLYINSEGSLPLVRALIDGGMSQGAALAFLITGAGTSIGAVTGALTIARWRVIAIVVGTLWIGATILGYAYNLLLAAGMF